jgi:hypothetical protein
MAYHNVSRTNPNIDTDAETYSTIDIYCGSQQGSEPLPGYNNINAGFTAILANPIVLDIGHRYVMALTKGQYDLSNYTDRYYSFSIYCDQLEYQYDMGQKTQLLYQVYGNRYVNTTPPTDDIQLGLWDVANVAWKFINPTTKIINKISFWVVDDNGNPLTTPLPPEFSYPTNFNILIKKVNSHVIAVSVL